MKLTDNVFGAIFMAVSMLSFIGNDALMKFLFQTISVEQGIFMRGLVSVPLLAVIAYFRKSLFIRIDWRNWRVILVRAFAELASTMLFLTALAHMPLANITAILQSLPLTCDDVCLRYFLARRLAGVGGAPFWLVLSAF
jgi:S-adenosylmethionine uptake transporter